MAKFSELGIASDVIVGKGIELEDLFDRRILIEKVKIGPTNFPGKNSSGLRMQMQVVLAKFKNPEDLKPGEPEFEVDDNGKPAGQRRSCFTGSDILISAIQQAEAKIGDSLYPLDTTIVKIGKCFQFT